MYVYTVTEPSQQEERAEHRVAMVVCMCVVCMYVCMSVCLCNEMWVVESDKTRRRGYGGARVVYKGTKRQLECLARSTITCTVTKSAATKQNLYRCHVI